MPRLPCPPAACGLDRAHAVPYSTRCLWRSHRKTHRIYCNNRELCTQMPKKTDDRVVRRIYLLSRQQPPLTLDKILGRLEREFGATVVPDRSTISRHIKRFPDRPPEGFEEDMSFRWSGSAVIPSHQFRPVLNVWAFYLATELDRYFGPFTDRVAKWTSKILDALDLAYPQGAAPLFTDPIGTGASSRLRPGRDLERKPIGSSESLPIERDVLVMALEYAWREIGAVVLDQSFDPQDLDMWLAFTPWKGATWIERYRQTRDRLGTHEFVSWHYFDLKWLDEVHPQVAASHREFIPHVVKEPRSPDERAAQEKWLHAVDGLLGSQLRDWARRRQDRVAEQSASAEDEPEPWYVAYLDEIWKSPDLDEYKKSVGVAQK